jgi:hypothetical protein
MAKEKVKLWTPPFVIGFPSLFTARKGESDDGSETKAKFGCTAIWTPANFTPAHKKLWQDILDALNEESVRVFKKPWKELPANVKRGLRNGNEKPDLDGFGEGTRFASLTSNLKPGVVDINGNEIIDPSEVFAGCIARATVNVYSYSNKGKGVALGLYNIQILAGEGHAKVRRLDGRGNPGADFDEVESDWLDQDEGSVDDDDGF